MNQSTSSAQEKDELNQSISAGHELRDLSIRGILIFGMGLIIMGAIALMIVTSTQFVLTGRGPSLQFPPINLANVPVPTPLPTPHLEAIPGNQLQELLAQENKQLDTYGWVDQQNGVVHIPIDRAMEILIQRGLPTRPTDESKFEDTGEKSPSDSSSGRMMENYP